MPAYPGTVDLNAAYTEISSSAAAIREYISSGGRYMGICLGAFLAGHSPGLGITPPAVDTDSEISQKGAQVTGEQDTIIQVDWTFQSGPRKGQTMKGRWVYFQDGVMISGLDAEVEPDTKILGEYTKSGDVAASVTRYGKGHVALIGLHPEANKTWCKSTSLHGHDGTSSTSPGCIVEMGKRGGLQRGGRFVADCPRKKQIANLCIPRRRRLQPYEP
jgi:hypothetical protein